MAAAEGAKKAAILLEERMKFEQEQRVENEQRARDAEQDQVGEMSRHSY
eukprot:SAG31_NODE_777_length_12167_cov_6.570683_9_plen_49_part_00